MKHTCQALGCSVSCFPEYLMCGKHWGMVSPNNQKEVYATIRYRSELIGATWAPWWRAQATAIAEVAFEEDPNTERRDQYLKKEMAFAKKLEEQHNEPV